MTAIIFLLILSFLVLIHELGHFLTARKFGMKVEEFGLGYPPKALRLFTDKLGTVYTLNWLPVGGFVRLFGEDGSLSVEGEENKTTLKGAFFTKPVWQRLVVVLAGATINFIFGVIAFGAIYSYTGIPVELQAVRVEEVAAQSPAAEAGLQVGDLIVGIGEPEVVGIKSVGQYIEQLNAYVGTTAPLKVERNDAVLEIPVYVRGEKEIPAGEGATGVVVNDFELRHYPLWQMPFRGMVVGLKAALQFSGVLLQGLGGMVKDLVSHGKVPSEVAGPVGIVHMAQQEGLLTSGLIPLLNFMAILSINLAIVNVLPFPALDGGRAMFLLIEGLTRKKLKPEIEQWANVVGFGLLIVMIVLISIRDVSRIDGVRDWLSSLR